MNRIQNKLTFIHVKGVLKSGQKTTLFSKVFNSCALIQKGVPYQNVQLFVCSMTVVWVFRIVTALKGLSFAQVR